MEDGSSSSGGDNDSSSKNTITRTSEETIHINIKTLNSNVFTLQVREKEPVSLLKEMIAREASVLPEQQSLIFRGRTLKGNHLLSDHFVEDGDTLHLLLRQPVISEGQNTNIFGEVRSTENQGENPYNDLSQIFSYLAVNSADNTSTTNTVVPDSLVTLSAFISHMEHALSAYSGYQSSPPSNAQSVWPSQPLQYPSPETLITILERAQQLLRGSAASTLSHISESLERARSSTNLAVRNQIHVEAMHVGTMINYLGSLLLELGRTISMLHIGDSSAELTVNSGPSIFISESGPNSIMLNQTTRNDGTPGNGQTDTPCPNSYSNLDNSRHLPENKVDVNVCETDGRPNNPASCYPSDTQTLEAKDNNAQTYQESIDSDDQHLMMMTDIHELSAPSINSGVVHSGLRESQQVQEQSPDVGGMLPEMAQQMMSFISQDFGVNSSKMSTSIAGDTGFSLLNGNDMLDERNLHMYLQPVAEGIQLQDSPREVFHNLLQVANQLYGGNDELLNDIGGDNDLINDFMEMLRRQAGFWQPGEA